MTLGEKALKLLSKECEPINILDLEQETEKEFFKEMEKIISTHKNFADRYYIQILMLQENFLRKYLPNIFTRKFIVRKSAPLPSFDTTLYAYDNRQDQLYFYWTIPSAETVYYLKSHLTELDTRDRELLEHVKEKAPELFDKIIL